MENKTHFCLWNKEFRFAIHLKCRFLWLAGKRQQVTHVILIEVFRDVVYNPGMTAISAFLPIWQILLLLKLFYCISAWLYLGPLCNVRERFAASSFCLSASSSWESLCFSSAERAWPALTKASGVCKERRWARTQKSWAICMCASNGVLQSNLVSEHEGDYFQHVHTPLLLTLGRRQELDQVIETTHVNGPQQPIMDAGVIIHFLQEKQRLGKKYKWDDGVKEWGWRSDNVGQIKLCLLYDHIGIHVKVRPSLHRDLQVHEAHSWPAAGSSLSVGYPPPVSAPSPESEKGE